jgi:hypothetical protein
MDNITLNQTELGNPTYVDEFGQTHHDNHHHGHHHHDHHEPHLKKNDTATWSIGLCICICAGLLLVFFFCWIAFAVQTTNHGHDIHHLAVEQQKMLHEKEITEMSDLGNIIYNTVSKNRLSLCYTGFYFTLTDDDNATLTELEPASTTTTTITKKARRKDKDPFYYLIDARLIFHFNVDLEKLIKDGDRLNHLKSLNRPFMSIQSDITSNYHQFSTIKLVEMGLDAHSRLLKPLHTPIILCSQNPYIKKIPCYSTIVKSPLLSLKYTMVTEMSYSISSSSQSSIDGQETGGGGGDADDDVIFENGQDNSSSTATTTKKEG